MGWEVETSAFAELSGMVIIMDGKEYAAIKSDLACCYLIHKPRSASEIRPERRTTKIRPIARRPLPGFRIGVPDVRL